jgi:CHAD domain-containing protein
VSPDRRLARRVSEYVSQQCAEILLSDVALRDHDDVRSVHRMRVGLRRLRSVVQGFAGLMQDEATALADDLRWVAGQLGAVRDLDVLDARITAAVRTLPAEDLVGPVARHLHETLNLRRSYAGDDWQRAWADDRYQRVMVAVARWHAEPPVDVEAEASPSKILSRATARVNRRLAGARTDPERWHDARKAAKRLRYVAEVVAPLTSSAAGTAKRAKRLQTQLGEHQDATVAAQLLAEQGRAAGAREDDNGFSYGLLLAEQRRLAARSLKGLPKRI